jgi:6-phosphogluconolactonase
MSVLCLGATLLSASAVLPAQAKTFVYVSAAEDGEIDSYQMDEASGRLTVLDKTAAGRLVMPLTVSPDRRFLYASVRSKPYTVHTYAIDASNGVLKLAAKTPVLADNKVYLSTDATGRYLFSASFGGHNIGVSALGTTGLAEAEPFQVVPFGEKAHCILPDRSNRFVYAINFGGGEIHQFLFDAASGRLTPNDPATIGVGAATGPRLMALSPDNRNLYVITQPLGTILQFAVDGAKGTLAKVGETAAVPFELGLQPGVMKPGAAEANSNADDEGGVPRIWASDIQITPNGKFLYATERRSNRILLLSVAPGDGKPTYVANFETEKQPRGIRIDPTGKYLVASGEKSDHLSVYRIDATNGRLTLIDRYPVGKGANWVAIVDLP